MLPGGLQILGILMVDASDVGNAASHTPLKRKLEKLLQSIETTNQKTSFANTEDMNCESFLYVLNLNRKGKASRLQGVQMPIDPSGKVSKDAELKWKQSEIKQSALEDKSSTGPWQVIKANFVLDYPVVFSPDQTEGLTLSGKVDIALQDVKRSISTATVLFDGPGRMHSSSGHYLDPTLKISNTNKKDGGKKSKGKSSKKHQLNESSEYESETEESRKEYTADILLGAYPSNDEDECENANEITIDSGSRLRFCGKMCIRVYMRPRATIKEATHAIKEDILRSLRGRLEMHCDSLVGEETKGTEKEEMPIVHEPPRRCLIGLPLRDEDEDCDPSQGTDPIMISDFLYPGETSYDSIESVNEVFGFEPAIARMDDEQELVAGIQSMNLNGSGELTAGSVTHTVKDGLEEGKSGTLESPSKLIAKATKKSNYNLIAILLSVIVAIAGMAVSYLAMSTGTNVVSEKDEFVVPSRTNDFHPNIEDE